MLFPGVSRKLRKSSNSDLRARSASLSSDRTSPVAAVLDQGHDEMCGDFNEEPETPYGTPDETATEEPALPSKRCRRDATTVDATVEETLAASAQRLEPQWMVSRSARDKKGKRASTQRSTSLTREGEATQ
ncbi:hypothetical protein MTO96_036339 [Rhipicephalus appendiculatus]